MFIADGTNTICAPNYLPKSQRTLQISPEIPSQSQSSTLRLASPEDELLLSGINRLGTYSLEFSLRVLNAVSAPGTLSQAAEAALTRIETAAAMAVDSPLSGTGVSANSWIYLGPSEMGFAPGAEILNIGSITLGQPENALDDIAAEYGGKKNALDAFYSDKSLNALLDGMEIWDADERESILAVLKDIYAVRDAELTEKYTAYAERRLDSLCLSFGVFDVDESSIFGYSVWGITYTSYRTAMEAVWKEKMEIAPKLALTVDKENLAAAITQYSLKNSAVKLNVDGFDFSYKDLMAISHILKGLSAPNDGSFESGQTFEAVNLRAAAVQLTAENTMSAAAARKFMEIYEATSYKRGMETAARMEAAKVSVFYSKTLGISVSQEQLDRILQELNDQAKLFRVLATVPAETFKDSFQETIRAFTEVAWKNNWQVDVAGLVNGWNAYLKYSKSDFADLSGYEIKTAVDIRA